MQPEAQTAQPSASLAEIKFDQKEKSLPWIIIILSVLISSGFVVGSFFYPYIFSNSWIIYILVFFPPVTAIAVYFLTRKPIEKEEQQITRLEQSTASLNSQATLYYAILQSIQEGMIIANPQGVISFSNKKAAEILQTDTSNLINQPLNTILNSDQLHRNSMADYQLEINTLLGKKITLKINSFPLVSNAQNQGTIYIITDISGAGELERLKLDFVAQAAHQLRTPLTILKSYLSVLSDSVGNKLTADDKQNLDRAVVGANQLALLIENLLNVSKIEGGKLDLHPQLASIEQLVSLAIKKNINNANQKGVKIYFQQSAPLPQIIVDPNLIEQAVDNLLANAVENSHKEGEVTVSTSLQNNTVIVSVMDKGIGIPSEATNNLFTKFYKVSTNLVQASKGVGLGLYNTKAIIEAHGGTISVNSLLGKGSTFWFTLPIRK